MLCVCVLRDGCCFLICICVVCWPSFCIVILCFGVGYCCCYCCEYLLLFVVCCVLSMVRRVLFVVGCMRCLPLYVVSFVARVILGVGCVLLCRVCVLLFAVRWLLLVLLRGCSLIACVVVCC